MELKLVNLNDMQKYKGEFDKNKWNNKLMKKL